MKYREREVYLNEIVTPIEVIGHFLSRQLYGKAPPPLYPFEGGRLSPVDPTACEDATVFWGCSNSSEPAFCFCVINTYFI